MLNVLNSEKAVSYRDKCLQTDLVIRTAVLPVAARNASTDAPTRRHNPTDRHTEHLTHEKIAAAATTEMESTTDHRECSQMG